MTYNRYMYGARLKIHAGKNFIEKDTIQNFDKSDYESRFTIEKLNECREPFDQYIKSFGTSLPVNTRISWLNTLGNKVASKTHYIRTNQPYAAQVRKIMDEALEDNERIKQKAKDQKSKKCEFKHLQTIDLGEEETKIVIEAIKKIKAVHNKMVEKGISGDVRKAIGNTLTQFKVDISSHELVFKIPYTYKKRGNKDPVTVDVIVKPSDIIDKISFRGERPLSPPLTERMLSRPY